MPWMQGGTPEKNGYDNHGKETISMRSITTIRELDKNKHFHLFFSILLIVISALGQTFVMQVFMEPCNLISGGFTGIALFIQKLCFRVGIPFSTSLGILLLNVPAAIWAYRRISKRFVMLTVLQFTLVSVLLEVCAFHPLVEDKVLNILFGGIGWGFTIALALRAGGSTGGTDFIAQYVSTKLHKSIFDYVFYANCVMYVLYGFSFGWLAAGYSILFQFLSTKAISSLYRRYSQVTVQFTTTDPDQVADAFFTVVHHGISIIEATGAYSGRKYFICQAVISTYELSDVIANVRRVDPNVLVNTFNTSSFYGNFYQQPIE